MARGWYLQPEAPLAVPLKRPCGLCPRGRINQGLGQTNERLEALGARCGNLSSDDDLELVDCALQLVVDDRVGELVGQLALLERLGEPFLDLALAFGAACAQTPFELLAVRRRGEDRDAAGAAIAYCERAGGLAREQDRPAAARDPLNLRPQRPRAPPLAPRKAYILEERILGELPVELLVRPEVVLAVLLLLGPARAGRRRDGQRQLRNAFEQQPRKGALPLAGRAGDDENGRALTC